MNYNQFNNTQPIDIVNTHSKSNDDDDIFSLSLASNPIEENSIKFSFHQQDLNDFMMNKSNMDDEFEENGSFNINHDISMNLNDNSHKIAVRSTPNLTLRNEEIEKSSSKLSTDNLMDSFTNAAQQNYRLWLYSFLFKPN